MKTNILLVAFIAISNFGFTQTKKVDSQRINNYTKFLDSTQISAKEYVLKQFEKYDIVILAERYHQEKTQYTLINDIVNDDYFVSNVGNVCIEIGSQNLSESLNNYLKNNNDNLEKGIENLLQFQRNVSFYPLWENTSYFSLLKNIFIRNRFLNQADKINLYLCDRIFDWKKINNIEDWKKAINDNRDSIMAKNISLHYEKIKHSKRNKMLVILNEAHAITNPNWTDMWQKRAGQYLADKYGQENIASICINSVATDMDDQDILIQNGYWDVAFSFTDKYDLGFDFQNSPFGNDAFDYATGKNNEHFKYKDIFTGFVFYLPIEKHQLSTGIPNLVSSSFRREFLRRIKIFNGKEYYNELKNDTILLGWNLEEYFEYDNLIEKLNKIELMKNEYIKEIKK